MTGKVRKLEGKYLTFALGDEEYGIEALKVQGIMGMQTITPIPNVPRFFLGVVNVRNAVSPVISARLRMGMPEIDYTPLTCLILVNLGESSAGMVVDEVRDVVDIVAGQIEEPPNMTSSGQNEVIGLAKVGEKIKILLDVEAVLADVVKLSGMAADAPPA
ncbi:MAG: chemotaxis protein CheW [Planctomycetota bacterium]|jgi:purine-binding chemotaxis protein CheW|nr:chemotaxis protein CheW [Planctomycetota bacterium]